ncbi:MAG: hypothetical protein ACKOOF_00945 [Planctomycetaceae bacterium]
MSRRGLRWLSIGSRASTQRRRLATARLAAERLERRLAMTTLPVTFTVPVEVANKGVYAAVFGNPTTSNTAAFVAGTDTSMTVGNSRFYPAGGSGFGGEITISDGTSSTVYAYQTNASNTFGGLQYVQGATPHTYAAGSVVSFAGPGINQAPFVYLTSPANGPARTTTAAAVPSGTITPVLPGVLPVTSTQGFSPSGSLTVYPPGQPGNSQVVTYTGISGNSFTGVVCGQGIGLNYVVTQGQTTTATTAPIGSSNPTSVPVNSTAGFPNAAGSLVAYSSTTTVRLTYTGTTGSSFTGVYFLDNAAINGSFTIVEPNVLGATIGVPSMPGFSSSGQLLVQAPAGLATSPVQTSTNVAVSYAGATGTSFTGVTAFPSGALPTLPSGGAVYQLPGPTSATTYAPVPSSGNLPLVSLFPNAGSIPGSGMTTAKLTLPDPAVTGILSGVIVISVGTPVALPVTTKSVSNMGVPVNVASVGSPTPATNADDVFGIFEWGLTSTMLDFDVSEVDQVGFPFSVTTVGTAPPPPADPVNGVGMRQDRAALFQGYKPFIETAKASYAPATAFLQGRPVVPNIPNGARGMRLTAPQDIIGNLQSNPPTAVAAVPAGGPGTAGTSAYYWVTALGAGGNESMPSAPVQGTTTDVQSALQISWQEYPYATGYNVYWSSGTTLANAQRIASNVSGTSFTDPTPAGHAKGASGAAVPANNYLYDRLNSYYTSALVDFFAYYAPTGTSVCGVPGANRIFQLDDQATKTKWTGRTQTGLTIGSQSGYTALVLTGEAGTWGSQFAGKTIWVVLPLFSSNTNDTSLGTLPPFPSNLVSSAVESGSAMVIAGDGVFGSYSASTDSSFVSPGDSANLSNNIVSAFNRGLTPMRLPGGAWSSVLPPTYWANSPLLNTATPATTGGTLPAGSYRYWITAVDINGTTGHQTTFSNVVEATATAGTSSSGPNSVALAWTAVNFSNAGAVYAKSFNIYRSTQQTDGTWSTPEYRANVPNAVTPVTNWTDTNAAPTGTPGPLFTYYSPGTASNYYAAYFADPNVSYNGLSYGYPYADKNGQSTNVQMNYPGGIKGLAVTLNPWTRTSEPPAPPGVTPGRKPVAIAPDEFQLREDTRGRLTWPAGRRPFADADSSSLTVTLSVIDGAIDARSTRNVIVGGVPTARTFQGSVAALNRFFRKPGRITYTPAVHNRESRTLTTTASDGMSTSDPVATRLRITPVDDRPTIVALPTGFATAAATPVNLRFTAGPFADPDARARATFRVRLRADAGDAITAAAGRGVTVSGSGTDRVTVRGTLADLNAYFTAADGIAYRPATGLTGTRTVGLAIRDLEKGVGSKTTLAVDVIA